MITTPLRALTCALPLALLAGACADDPEAARSRREFGQALGQSLDALGDVLAQEREAWSEGLSDLAGRAQQELEGLGERTGEQARQKRQQLSDLTRTFQTRADALRDALERAHAASGDVVESAQEVSEDTLEDARDALELARKALAKALEEVSDEEQ